jgi:hypothetical protein
MLAWQREGQNARSHEQPALLYVHLQTLSHYFHMATVVQTGSGVHPTSYTMGAGGSFPGVKRPGREADHSPPTSAEVKKIWIYTPTPPYVFMA